MLFETDVSEEECHHIHQTDKVVEETETTGRNEEEEEGTAKRTTTTSSSRRSSSSSSSRLKEVKWIGWKPKSWSYWGYLVYMVATLAFFLGSVFSIGFCKQALDPHCSSLQKIILVDWIYFIGGLCFFVGAVLFYLSLCSSSSSSPSSSSFHLVWKPRCPIFQSSIAALIAGSLYLLSVILARIDYFSPSHNFRHHIFGPSILFIIGTGFLVLACLITGVKLWFGKKKVLDFKELSHWSILLRLLGSFLFLEGGLASFWPEGDVYSLVMIKIPFLIGSLSFCLGVYLALFWMLNLNEKISQPSKAKSVE